MAVAEEGGGRRLPSIDMPTHCHPPHLAGDPLCQFNPPQSLGLFHPDDRATESIEGFLRDGVKQRSYLLESLKLTGRRVQWLVGINHEEVLSIYGINEDWKTFTNRMRRYYSEGLAFCWVREVTPSDTRRLHYHLAILDGFRDDRDEMESILKKCLSSFPKHHLWIEPSPRSFETISYMFKLDEKQKDKILLFKPRLGLRRHGCNGRFLPANLKKKDLAGRVHDREKGISDGASMVFNREVIPYLANFLQLPLNRVRRIVGQDPYDPVWERWWDRMKGLR